MPKTTEAQAKATKKYLSGRAEIKLWMTPEEKQRIQDKAAAASKSVNKYMIDCALNPGDKTAPPVKAPRDISRLPQPPETIPPDDMNAQIVWRVNHGWTEEELQIFLSQN